MRITRNLHLVSRFLGPLLAFAALSGLGTGFIFGAVVTVYGLVAVVLIFWANNLSVATAEIVKSFPGYALWVLLAIAGGAASGFFTGLVFALVGGKASYWWSFLLVIGAAALLDSFSINSLILPIVVGSFGAQFPQAYLLEKPLHHEIEKPIARYLRDSWLARPSETTQRVGLFLPLVPFVIWEICFR